MVGVEVGGGGWMGREGWRWGGSGTYNKLVPSAPTFRAQELCESRGGRPGLPVPNSPLMWSLRVNYFVTALVLAKNIIYNTCAWKILAHFFFLVQINRQWELIRSRNTSLEN